MKYHYFVSYYCETEDKGVAGYGECGISRESPIFDYYELDKVRNYIKELNNYKSLVILNWRRFEQAE